MGFLDRAIRRGLGNAVETVIKDKVLGAVAPEAERSIRRNTETLQQAASTLSNVCCPSCGAPLSPGARFCSGCGTRMDEARQARQAAYSGETQSFRPSENIRQSMPELLRTEFSQYGVRQNVPASALGVSLAPVKPYDYVLYRGDLPAAAIMLTDHNRDKNAAFLNAKAAAKQARVPFVNFYTHMENERGYVSARIRSFL